MFKGAIWLLVTMAIMLTTSCTASGRSECDVGQIERVLIALDSAQKPPPSAASLRALFEPAARVVAVSPAKTYDRSATEFIEEKANSTDPAPLAYEFEAATVACKGDHSAKVVRRGCQVAEQEGDIFELSQTERLELVQASGHWRIHSMTSTLDAMIVNGRMVFQDQPVVTLESCKKASSSTNVRTYERKVRAPMIPKFPRPRYALAQ